MIEELLPGNKTKMRVLKSIYESEGINLTTLIHKAKASPNFVLRHVNALIAYGILKENRIQGKKKVHMRTVKPNLSTEMGRAVFYFVESEKKFSVLEKYKFLKPYADQLEELCNRNNIVVILYGSYTRLAAEKESDLDLLFIGKIDKPILRRIKEIFITLDIELSLKMETAPGFLKQKNKPLYQNILREHMVLCGGGQFMKMLQKVQE